ncbi:MAG: HlyD family efflux transporter periplasmic adaptor subunit [Sphingopyxis sp.]|uniref:HlyD family secretion protein n=1 Tax=Sphingopyxis sp. TaxID=1908224 RepID=UPI002AB94C08|nr:HlyD family efflux transporter periplasmic adaptor subunit [Sphingopyxis sp.]MDZ3831177.1 HlyD family efflux transporter periplasmic adaptor subunit [Sphingopyxis sp.]
MKASPKLAIPLVLVVLGGAAAWYAWPQASEPTWLGYVEGEAVYVSAPQGGILASRAVDRGARVKAGDPLFALDAETGQADLAQLEASERAAEAQRADLAQQRQRQAELDITRANMAAAQAQSVKAQKDYDRVAALAGRGFVSKAALDSARAARDVARANVAQLAAQERAGEITAGRIDQQRAAAAQALGAAAAVRGQRKRVSDLAPVAPATGQVEQTFFNPGEVVPAGNPVVSIIPDDRRKLRFFVPETRLAAMKIGAAIRYRCDACGGERRATIRYIAPRAEFTPPVIYSEQARAKLVFMVEASLPVTDDPLPLGLPVEVVAQ